MLSRCRLKEPPSPFGSCNVDGRPRWEYRYLKNLLLRERSILSSTLLLSADPGFTQEGDRAIKRLPSTPKEFLEWDVLVLGDIPPSTLNSNQATIIKDLVSTGNLSVLWIGGEQWNPNQWGKSQLAELLPMFRPSLVRETNEAFNIQPTPLGVERGIFHQDVADINPRKNDNGFATNDLMYWSQIISPNDLKPGVEILATTRTNNTKDGSTPTPSILSMRFGLGTTIYTTTDEFWRWRSGRGEKVYEQFWVQLIRSTQTNKNSNVNKSIVIETKNSEHHPGTPVVFTVHIPSNLNTPNDLKFIEAEIVSKLKAETSHLRLMKSNDTKTFTGVWIPKFSGTHNIKTKVTTTTPKKTIEAGLNFDVIDISDEATFPETNHTHMLEISKATNGAHILPKNLNTLQKHIPDRSTTTVTTRNETVWGLPLLYLPFVLFLGVEWVVRKHNGIV